MREVRLTNSDRVAIVDDADYERVIDIPWQLRREKGIDYACYNRVVSRQPRKVLYFRMHRIVINAPVGLIVDHIDGDGLNNRKSNLRIATFSENGQNKNRLPRNTSGYRGVTWNKQSGKWQASIKCQNRYYYLGLYSDREAAARAYDEAALRLFGPLARVNFPAHKRQSIEGRVSK